MGSESEKRWTPYQQRAIDHSGSDLLLSAAAGSGKTATLTARLIRLLCSPEGDALPSQVLAVTFTNAAAAEMRSRLYDAAVKEVARCPSNKNDSSFIAVRKSLYGSVSSQIVINRCGSDNVACME